MKKSINDQKINEYNEYHLNYAPYNIIDIYFHLYINSFFTFTCYKRRKNEKIIFKIVYFLFSKLILIHLNTK